jgi:pyruvate dehydrogenase E1 component alpha subunit
MNRSAWLNENGLAAYRMMLTIREFERRLATYLGEGLIPGSTHPSVGMEAIAVGVSVGLHNDDVIASTHRGHAHCLAKGADPQRILAEIFGRATGYCGGKGGSMHLAARDVGIIGTNGIVGASIGLATGAALAAKHRLDNTVAIAYFGDGAMNQGIFHEALNLAAVWRLPCIYVCENNHFAQSSRVEDMVSISDLSARAASYGIPGVGVDGMDVVAVAEAASGALERARSGKGPSLIVADTYRYLGHMIGDTEIYRSKEEVADWKPRDCLARLEADLSIEGLLDDTLLAREHATVRGTLDDADRFARSSPKPDPVTALSQVYG